MMWTMKMTSKLDMKLSKMKWQRCLEQSQAMEETIFYPLMKNLDSDFTLKNNLIKAEEMD